jgi:hypothetical protein
MGIPPATVNVGLALLAALFMGLWLCERWLRGDSDHRCAAKQEILNNVRAKLATAMTELEDTRRRLEVADEVITAKLRTELRS